MATVELTPGAAKQLAELPKEIQGRIRSVIKRLENWPTVGSVKALKGKLAGFFRIRAGDYRVRFFVKRDTLIVDKIGHRKDIYEG